jgi:hypothetical protein
LLKNFLHRTHVKLKFAQELEVLIIKDIVEKCGGNPDKVDDILNTS